MKKYIINTIFTLILSVFLILPQISFGQNIDSLNNTGTTKECTKDNFVLQGPYDIKKSVSSYFFVSKDEEKVNIKTNFSIFFQGKLIYTNTSLSGEIRYSFEKIGSYEIKASIYDYGCVYQKNSIIRVYKDIILYIGNFLQDFNFGLLDNIQQNDFLLSTIILDNVEGEKNNVEENIVKKDKYISQTDYIFLYNSSLSKDFEIIQRLKEKTKSFDKKKIFIITKNDQNLTKKLMSSKIHKQNLNNIYVISYQKFWDSIISLSIDNPNFDILQKQKPVIIEVEKNKWSFSGLIDILIFYGINIKFIELLFISIIAILIIVFFKQVVGFPGYGLYFPIIASFTLFYTPIKFFILLFCFSFLAHYTTKYITKKLMLLVYAKIGLYLSVYAIVSIFGFFTYFLLPENFVEHINFSTEIFVSWFLIGMIGKKVMGDVKNIKSGLFQTVWFHILVRTIFKLFHIQSLQNFVLLNPSVIFICIILIILLGRYTGLMVTEYIRFRPFIKKKFFKK